MSDSDKDEVQIESETSGNISSVTFLHPTFIKEKRKSKSKKQRRSEKKMEEKEEELPWPQPSNEFKIQKKSKETCLGIEKEIIELKKKLDKYFVGNGKDFNVLGAATPGRFNPFEAQAIAPLLPLAPASSEDLCTLFRNSCQVSSGNRKLPPIGIFWDLENITIPKGKSALVAVQRIRQRFFPGHYEAEFVCVCDIRKEVPGVIQDLNDAQVTVIHVSGNSKNAADDKLRQSMRRFADIYSGPHGCSTSPYPATIILISGDINFSSDLSDIRHRKNFYVILLHNRHASEALLLCAHEQYDFHSFLGDLPPRTYKERFVGPNQVPHIPLKGGLHAMDVLVCDLPGSSKTYVAIKNRLKKLSENCGGKVIALQGQFGLIRFPNKEAAFRATKRMNGEDVMGSKIRVVYSSQMEFCEQGHLENAQQFNFNRAHELSQGPGHVTPHQSNWNNTKTDSHCSYSTTPLTQNRLPFSGIQNDSAETLSPRFIRVASQKSQREQPFQNESPPKVKPETLAPRFIRIANQHQENQSVQMQTFQNLPPRLLRQTSQNLQPIQHPPRVPEALPSLDESWECSSCDVKLTKQGEVQPIHSSTPIKSFKPQQEQQPKKTPPSPISTTNNSFLQTQEQIDSPSSCKMPIPEPAVSKTNEQPRKLPAPHPIDNLLSNSDIDLTLSAIQLEFLPTNKQKKTSDVSDCENTISNSDSKEQVNCEQYVDLILSNVDPFLGNLKMIRHKLMTTFSEHVKVIGVWTSIEEGKLKAMVRVGSIEEAQQAVEKLHRKTLGSKRILVSLDKGKNDEDIFKDEVASLLEHILDASMPLYKFREIFEKRYRRSVSSCDLYRLRDVVSISEGDDTKSCNLGRTISLSKEWKMMDGNVSSPISVAGLLPNVMIELKTLNSRVLSLLTSHEGKLQLCCFLDCYEAEFAKMEEVSTGVPLEHLLDCIKGVEISHSENGTKVLQLAKKNMDDIIAPLAQPIVIQLAQFGREIIDLLKTQERCSLSSSKLIPAYLHHFQKPCPVTNTEQLHFVLETIPHVVQIMGSGHQEDKVITLSHKAQMKRFATDMLRILKARSSPIKVHDFPTAFSQVFPNRQEFIPQDYGVCCLSDLITELVEHSSLVTIIKNEEEEQGCELLWVREHIPGGGTLTPEAKISISSLASQDSVV